MKKALFSLALSLLTLTSCQVTEKKKVAKLELKDGLPTSIAVFENGKYGYPKHRIPNLILTKKNTLIAVIEGRQGGDHSQNDIIIRRSEDGGKKWGKVIVVADMEKDCLIDCSAIVDQISGRIHIFFNYFKNGYHNYKSPGPYDNPNSNRHFQAYSDDDGITWSKPREITKSVRPESYNFAVICPGGHGITLTKGKYKGRMVFPVWGNIPLKDGDPKSAKRRPYCLYSDDRGETWKRSDYARIADDADPNGFATESQIVELDDGRLFMESRTPKGKKIRRTSYSSDGGMTWSKMSYNKDLIEPRCQATMVTYEKNGKRLIFLCGPNSQKGRQNGAIFVSKDGGKTFPIVKNFTKGKYGYSSMVVVGDSVAVFYECGGKMLFTTFPINWFLK